MKPYCKRKRRAIIKTKPQTYRSHKSFISYMKLVLNSINIFSRFDFCQEIIHHTHIKNNPAFVTIITTFRHLSWHPMTFHCSWWHLCILTWHWHGLSSFLSCVLAYVGIRSLEVSTAFTKLRCVFGAGHFVLKINQYRMHFGERRSRNGTLTEDSQTTNMSGPSVYKVAIQPENNIITSKSIVLSIIFSSSPWTYFWAHMEREVSCPLYLGDATFLLIFL